MNINKIKKLLIPLFCFLLLILNSSTTADLSGASSSGGSHGGGGWWSEVWDATAIDGFGSWNTTTINADRCMRQVIRSADTSGSGSKIRINVINSSGVVTTILTNTMICVRNGASDDCVATGTDIKWNGGNDGFTVPVSTISRSDEATYSFDTNTNYLVAICYADGSNQNYENVTPDLWYISYECSTECDPDDVTVVAEDFGGFVAVLDSIEVWSTTK